MILGSFQHLYELYRAEYPTHPMTVVFYRFCLAVCTIFLNIDA